MTGNAVQAIFWFVDVLATIWKTDAPSMINPLLKA
jgi:hypothetical protein